MSTTDLMAGDLVLITEPDDYHGYIGKVVIVNNETGYIMVFLENHGYHDVFCDDVQPILLMPEILEKNGFIKTISEDGLHYRYTLTEGNISFSVLYANGVFQWIFPIDIKYVHKLQHILKFCEIKRKLYYNTRREKYINIC